MVGDDTGPYFFVEVEAQEVVGGNGLENKGRGGHETEAAVVDGIAKNDAAGGIKPAEMIEGPVSISWTPIPCAGGPA